MSEKITLKSKASKYRNQKWINSNDGFMLFVVVHGDEIKITVWDADRRPIKIDHPKEIVLTDGDF